MLKESGIAHAILWDFGITLILFENGFIEKIINRSIEPSDEMLTKFEVHKRLTLVKKNYLTVFFSCII